MNRHAVIYVVCMVIVLVACNSAQSDWNRASASNTLTGYQSFLHKHPNDDHAADARRRIAAIEDDGDWKTARSANTEQSYTDYLDKHATGAHVSDARTELTALERAADWKSAQDVGTVAALQSFLQKYPQGAESDAAKQKLAALAGYRVQLGEAATQAAAERERRLVQQHFGKVIHEVTVAPPAPPDTRYRVLSGAMSKDAASTACAALKRAHEGCEVVSAT